MVVFSYVGTCTLFDFCPRSFVASDHLSFKASFVVALLSMVFPRNCFLPRVIERAIEAMRELNGRSDTLSKKDASGSLTWRSDDKKSQSSSDDMSKRKATKRSRLPAAAVKEMR